MRQFIFCLFVIFLVGCSSKPEMKVIKNPEMIALNNITVSHLDGGTFKMGSYDDKFYDKAPRNVQIDPFFIDKTEVTNAAYKQYIAEAGGSVRQLVHLEDPILGADKLPIVNVTHKEAQAFCTFYNKRLPTEAEWEYAAKGGSSNTSYFWGEKEDPMYMNYRGSNKNKTVDVGSYPSNGFGLYDMNGNAREWVEDTYEKDFYKQMCTQKDIVEVAKDAYRSIKEIFVTVEYTEHNCYNNPVNVKEGKYKSNRGGSFEYSEGYPASLSFRFFDDKDSTHRDLGFRCVADERVSNAKN